MYLFIVLNHVWWLTFYILTTQVQKKELENEREELRTQLTSAKESESSLKTQLMEVRREMEATEVCLSNIISVYIFP